MNAKLVSAVTAAAILALAGCDQPPAPTAATAPAATAGPTAAPTSIPPAAVNAASSGLGAILIRFSEDVDPASAQDVGHYQVSTQGDDPNYQSPQPPASAQYDATTLTLRLALSQPLKPGLAYRVQVDGVAGLGKTPGTMSATPLDFASPSLVVSVDPTQDIHPISPLIYGLSGASQAYLEASGATFNSWGGNPSTRYNWKLGNAWNAARDWEYRNGNYGYQGKAAHDDFISDTLAAGAAVRYALPTLGWVARNNDNNTCSFPTADGKCSNLGGANCNKKSEIADPRRANVPSTVDSVVQLVKHFTQDRKYTVQVFALDNEPELWGQTHYDVHPDCTTYDEVRDKYLEYAAAVRAAAPEAQLAGPNTCCWYFYWSSAAGTMDKLKHLNQDFLPWFLQEIRKHDEQTGVRLLDVLDIHFYPDGVYNDKVDGATAQKRLNMTRSLWDKTYVDESWINQPIYLIPRMKQLIADNYPGTRLGISEWNYGADKDLNGALAVGDVLGIFGREDVYYANYWRHPAQDSPGFFAFRMYGNFDGKGGRFGGTSIRAASTQPSLVSAYGSIDAQGRVYLMLLNKDAAKAAQPILQIANAAVKSSGRLYRYSRAQPNQITSESVTLAADGALELPPYSITLLVLDAQ